MKEATRNPESLRCGWCLQSGHVTAQCPGTREWLLPPTGDPRTTADEVNEAVAARMLGYRTLKNALLGWAREHGYLVPVEIQRADPDFVEER